MRNFANFFDAYLAYTSKHESTPRVRLWSAISIVAASLQRKIWMDRGYYKLYPNLYTFIVGRSGLIKKTTSTGIAVNLLREIEGFHIMSERLTAASLIDQMVMAGSSFECGTQQIKQSAVFAYASELSVFLQEVFGSITELLTTFYDCVPHDSTKPWVNSTLKRGHNKIYGPCLNILGASTKAWLTKCIPRTGMEGGFTSRVIFVVEDRLPDKLVPWPELDDEDDLTRLKLIEDLREIHSLSGLIVPTAEARKLYEQWYERHMRAVLPYNQDPRMIGYMSRKGDTILKLSISKSCATRGDLQVTVDDLVWAQKQLDSLEKDWRLAFDHADRFGTLSYEIMEFIHARTIVKKKELLENFAQYYPITHVIKCIEELKGMGEATDGVRMKDGAKIEFYAVPGWEEIQGIDGLMVG